MDEQHALFASHPNTIFINAHLGWLGSNLAELGRLMDRLPNMYTEIGAVLDELGRQPRFAREFLIKYQDRVLFGKDSWNPVGVCHLLPRARNLRRVLRLLPQISRLLADVWAGSARRSLRKLYYKNALRVIPGIDPAAFEQTAPRP